MAVGAEELVNGDVLVAARAEPWAAPRTVETSLQLRNDTEGRAYYQRRLAAGQDADGKRSGR